MTAYSERGIAHHRRGDFEAAIRDCSEAIRLNPREAKAYYGQAAVRDAQRDHKAALERINEAVRLDPKYAEAYNLRGSIHWGLDNLKEALDDFEMYVMIGQLDGREEANNTRVHRHDQGKHERS